MKAFSFIFIAFGLVAAVLAFANSETDIVFPIAELNNCANEQECKAYCDDSAHITECVAFAQAHNLISSEEADKARRFADLGAIGPGGCTGQNECEAYCENVSHIEECVAFAEEHDLLSPEELQEARQIAQAISQGVQLPGGCQSEAACEAYCEDFSHMNECLEFAQAAGFMSPEELREARQVAKAIEAGVLPPGGCRGGDECEAYCSELSHANECLDFAVAAGFIPPEEQKEARRMMSLMARGEMPGGCRNREECEAYCEDSSHVDECTTFFVKAGFMTPEEADLFRKTGGKGPGGCEREECETFCNNPDNQQVCFEFAKEHGLISREGLENIEQGVARFKEGIASAPSEVAACLNEKVGEDILVRIEAGTFTPTPELGEHMRSCFEEFTPPPFQEGEFQSGFEGEQPPAGFHPEDFQGLSSEEIERIIREREKEARERFEQGEFPQGGPPPDFEEFRPEGFERFVPDNIQEIIQRERERVTEQFTPEGISREFIPEELEQFVPEEFLLEPHKENLQLPKERELTGSLLDAFGPLLQSLLAPIL